MFQGVIMPSDDTIGDELKHGLFTDLIRNFVEEWGSFLGAYVYIPHLCRSATFLSRTGKTWCINTYSKNAFQPRGIPQSSRVSMPTPVVGYIAGWSILAIWWAFLELIGRICCLLYVIEASTPDVSSTLKRWLAIPFEFPSKPEMVQQD